MSGFALGSSPSYAGCEVGRIDCAVFSLSYFIGVDIPTTNLHIAIMIKQ